MKKGKSVIFRAIAAGSLCFVVAGCSDDNGTVAGDTTSGGSGGSSVQTGTGAIGISEAGAVNSDAATSGEALTGGNTGTGGAVATGGTGTITTADDGGKGNSDGNSSNAGSAGSAGEAGSTGNAGSAGNAGSSGSAGEAGSAGSAGNASEGQESDGCGKEPPAVINSVQFNGVARQIILDVPNSYDKNRAYPLVFSWHGMGVSVDMFRGYLNIAGAVGEDGIVVSLECATGSSGSWDYTNDPLFFDFLVEKFETEYCIDKNRIFSTGHSMGGFFNHYLACVRANVLRGAAPLAANVSAGTQCDGKLAMWYSQGESDFAGDGPTVRDFWVNNNGCDGNQGTPVSPLPCEGDTYTCTCTDYTVGCEDNPVRYCTFPGGHEIPTFIGKGVWAFFQSLK